MTERTPSTDSPSLLNFSVASASSLIALQVLSRGFTFILNQALFRLSSPAAFGAASIQFELILSTILFLSREGIRNALLRVKPQSDSDSTIKRANLSFLPAILGIPLALSTSLLYPRYAGQEIKAYPGFNQAILLYTSSAMIELCSEPMYNLAMASLRTNVRVRAEGLAITAKSVTTVLVLLYNARVGQDEQALRAFALGQLAYSVVLLAVYLVLLGQKHALPQKSSAHSRSPWRHFDLDTLKLSFSMTLQSLVKHFLTEGDKMILSWFSPLRDQGGYAMAVNYGSLVARILFQPIEETLRLFFSRTLTSRDSTNQASRTQAIETLHSLLSVQLALSVVLVVFGSAYLPALLPLLLPQQYLTTSAPSVLTAWVWYIPVLAVNGGLEAFLSSVASTKDLNSQSRWMIIFSAIYIISAILLYRIGLGDSSLVYANIINLTARIAYCLSFTSRYFNSISTDASTMAFQWRKTLPPVQFLAVAVVSAGLVRMSAQQFHPVATAESLGKKAILNFPFLLHIGVGGILAIMCLFTWWRTSGRFLSLPLRSKPKIE